MRAVLGANLSKIDAMELEDFRSQSRKSRRKLGAIT